MTETKYAMKKSPLINSSGLLPQNDIMLIVSCCNENGGLYLVSFTKSFFAYKKVFEGDARGLAKYKEGFMLTSNTHGLLLFDHDFQIINSYKPDGLIDFHGVAVLNELAYVVETYNNTIGLYKLPTLERIDELVLDRCEKDALHVNDIFIKDNQIYLSMFSSHNHWRESPVNSGVIIKLDQNNIEKKEVLFAGLRHPHSIASIDKDIVFCNSSSFEVIKNDDRVYKGNGYLRGLEKIGNTYFFGQSESRNVDWIRKENTNISVDSGIHVFHADDQISRFFSLPSPEVYGILNCSERIELKQDFADDKADEMLCQLFIDTGKGFNETDSVKENVSVGNNSIRIDLSMWPEIRSLRFDPSDLPCICVINCISAETENGTMELSTGIHNAYLNKENLYYFGENDPQIFITDRHVKIKEIVIDYDLYIIESTVEEILTELIDQHIKNETSIVKNKIYKLIKRH